MKKQNEDQISAIKIENLIFKYIKKNKKNNLDIKNIDIKKGQWVSILGPNGSGKSTLAKAIIDFNRIQKGKIFVNNKNIKLYSRKKFSKSLAYIPQEIDVPSGTKVYDFVSYGQNPYLNLFGFLGKKNKEIIEKAMKKTDTYAFKDKFMEELSGGERQKVMIAMVYAQQSDIILLDEPTTYLDVKNQYEILEFLKDLHNEGKTIISILHDINQAVQYSDRIMVIKSGSIFKDGAPSSVISKKNIKDIFGVDAQIFRKKNKNYIADIQLVQACKHVKDNK